MKRDWLKDKFYDRFYDGTTKGKPYVSASLPLYPSPNRARLDVSLIS